VEIGGNRFFEPKESQLQGTSEGYGAALQRLDFFSNETMNSLEFPNCRNSVAVAS